MPDSLITISWDGVVQDLSAFPVQLPTPAMTETLHLCWQHCRTRRQTQGLPDAQWDALLLSDAWQAGERRLDVAARAGDVEAAKAAYRGLWGLI